VLENKTIKLLPKAFSIAKTRAPIPAVEDVLFTPRIAVGFALFVVFALPGLLQGAAMPDKLSPAFHRERL